MRRCFIISPIGVEGSEIREHADDVFEFIVGPAMEELGIHAYRADHVASAGKITEQMFNSLLTDDLCIAILTFHNPNVFYELAIAQAAARPTVIMIEKGTAIPFDLHDLRAIEYDFKPRQIRDRVYVRQLVDHVSSIAANDWKVEVPFGRALSPLGAADHKYRVYDDLRGFGGDERWIDAIGETQAGFRAAGIGMTRWAKRRFRTLLMEKAQAGCAIRIMIMDPAHPALAAMINDDDGLKNLERISSANTETARVMEQICQENGNIRFKMLRHGNLSQQLILTDRRAVVRPHLFARSTSEAPVLCFEKPSRLHDTFSAEFDTLWERN